jgi:TonB family protein
MSWRFLAVIALLAGAAGQPLPPNVFRAGPGITRPRLLRGPRPAPEYSEEARLARLEGIVEVTMIVGDDGVPRDLRVTQPLGLGLDEAAIKTFGAWRFTPGTKDGQPVSVVETAQAAFHLGDKEPWRLRRAIFNTPEGASRPTVVKAEFPPPAGTGKAGMATLSFDVDETGTPENFRMEESFGQPWESEVIAAAREWRFNPGLRDGKPISVRCTLDFALNSP